MYYKKIDIPKLPWEDGRRAFTKKLEYISKMYFNGVFKEGWNFLMSCSLKATQDMHQPARQLYGIWMPVLMFLYRQFLAKYQRKTYDLCSLALCSVFYTVLICVYTVWSCFVSILTWKRKKADKIHIER